MKPSKNPLESKKRILGISMIAAVAIFVIAFACGKPEAIERDPQTFCRSDGPWATTAILIDHTDSLSFTTKADIEGRIKNLLNEIEENHEISLLEVDPMHNVSPSPIVQVCHPGDPDEADPLMQSEAILRRRWQQRFLDPLAEGLRKTLTYKEAGLSPIMEAMQVVSIQHLQAKRRNIPRRLVVISDFLQNSDATSFYKNRPDFDCFRDTPQARGLNVDMQGVAVELWLIQRNQEAQGDGEAVLRFFSSWVEENGGRTTKSIMLSGINR